MGFELINQFAAKILLVAADGDSINRISQKAGASYSYTHEWVERLEAIDVLARDDGVHIQDPEFVEAYRSLAAAVFRRECSLEDAYVLPNVAGMPYRFSMTDAVYFWTNGGYQIGRNQHDYPIFIDVLEKDVTAWERFFDEFGQRTRIADRIGHGDPGIYFVLHPRDTIEGEWVENGCVMPLEETVEWMQTYEANFQPALEMVDEMYDLELGVSYRERGVL